MVKDLKPLYVFGDTHLGAERSGGSTPTTKQKLKGDLLEAYQGLLNRASGCLLINGDWLDTDKIALHDLFECYSLTSKWLFSNEKLYVSEGNHCQAGNAENTSSFDLLCKLLQAVHGDKVVPIYGSLYLPEHDAYVVSSVRNQDLFDQAVLAIPECATAYLHCNFDNFFAKDAIHSLNLSAAQAQAIPAKRLVLSHEHGSRKMLNGKVHLIGAPFVSSVSDCLASDKKYMVKVTGSDIEYFQTWQAEDDYKEMDWHHLEDTGARFIRVVGEASAEESADAVSAISRFRRESAALVITNAVKIAGLSDDADLALDAETVTSFDVKNALYEILSAEEVVVVKKLLGEV